MWENPPLASLYVLILCRERAGPGRPHRHARVGPGVAGVFGLCLALFGCNVLGPHPSLLCIGKHVSAQAQRWWCVAPAWLGDWFACTALGAHLRSSLASMPAPLSCARCCAQLRLLCMLRPLRLLRRWATCRPGSGCPTSPTSSSRCSAPRCSRSRRRAAADLHFSRHFWKHFPGHILPLTYAPSTYLSVPSELPPEMAMSSEMRAVVAESCFSGYLDSRKRLRPLLRALAARIVAVLAAGAQAGFARERLARLLLGPCAAANRSSKSGLKKA